jgi:hypothetical protein
MSPALARLLAIPTPGRRPALATALCAAAAILLPVAAAQAGAGGTEFDPFYDTIVDWAQGSLGKAARPWAVQPHPAGAARPRGSIMPAGTRSGPHRRRPARPASAATLPRLRACSRG